MNRIVCLLVCLASTLLCSSYATSQEASSKKAVPGQIVAEDKILKYLDNAFDVREAYLVWMDTDVTVAIDTSIPHSITTTTIAAASKKEDWRYFGRAEKNLSTPSVPELWNQQFIGDSKKVFRRKGFLQKGDTVGKSGTNFIKPMIDVLHIPIAPQEDLYRGAITDENLMRLFFDTCKFREMVTDKETGDVLCKWRLLKPTLHADAEIVFGKSMGFMPISSRVTLVEGRNSTIVSMTRTEWERTSLGSFVPINIYEYSSSCDGSSRTERNSDLRWKVGDPILKMKPTETAFDWRRDFGKIFDITVDEAPFPVRAHLLEKDAEEEGEK